MADYRNSYVQDVSALTKEQRSIYVALSGLVLLMFAKSIGQATFIEMARRWLAASENVEASEALFPELQREVKKGLSVAKGDDELTQAAVGILGNLEALTELPDELSLPLEKERVQQDFMAVNGMMALLSIFFSPKQLPIPLDELLASCLALCVPELRSGHKVIPSLDMAKAYMLEGVEDRSVHAIEGLQLGTFYAFKRAFGIPADSLISE